MHTSSENLFHFLPQNTENGAQFFIILRYVGWLRVLSLGNRYSVYIPLISKYNAEL
jgi:hypothetical protein